MAQENEPQQSPHAARVQRMLDRRAERNVNPEFNSYVINESVPVDIKRVLKAYFAEKKIEQVRTEESGGAFNYTFNNTNTVTDANRDNIAGIIVTNSTETLEADSKYITNELVLGALENKTYPAGTQLPIPTYKITEETTFEKIDKGNLNTDAYIVVESSGLVGKSATIEVFEKEPLLAEADSALKLSVYDSDEDEDPEGKTAINETFGEDNKIKVKIKFHPDDDDTFKTWREAYDPATEDEATEATSTAAATPVIDYLWIKVVVEGEADLDQEFLKPSPYFELTRCNCCDATVDADGFVTHEKFTKNHITALERGTLASANAIILHRTVNDSAEATFTAFESGIGTHFAVDKDGKIYQTASLDKLTYHVGKIKSRCFAENSCSVEETATIAGWGWAPTTIYNHEKTKSYPDRYPMNKDSIGIEVVGNYINEEWEAIPDVQAQSVACVVNFLIKNYNLSTADDIYEHEDISYKTEGEGSVVYEAIKDLIE